MRTSKTMIPLLYIISLSILFNCTFCFRYSYKYRDFDNLKHFNWASKSLKLQVEFRKKDTETIFNHTDSKLVLNIFKCGDLFLETKPEMNNYH